ncbi:aldehyde dehydrogenase family protein [Acidothermaceae bacterium B102]|nr:aldehyde dehydrogenase family protein [Acidothermaceae bacterium B102]
MTSPAHAVIGQARWAAAALATYEPDRVQRIVLAVATAVPAGPARRLAEACLAHSETLTAGPQLDLSSGSQLLPSPVGVVVLVAPAAEPELVVWHAALLAAANRNVLLVLWFEGSDLADVVAAAADAGTAAGAPQGWLQGLAVAADDAASVAAPAGVDLVVVADESGVAAAGLSGRPWVHARPGGVPAWVTSTADVAAAADQVLRSRETRTTPYQGCEAVLLVDDQVLPQLVAALAASGAAVLSPAERDRLLEVMAVAEEGVSAVALAAAAGITVAASTRLLVVPVEQVVAEDPFVHPSRLPLLALLAVTSPEQGIAAARAVTRLRSGRAIAAVHTTDPKTAARLGAALQVSLLLVNEGVARPGTALEPTDLVWLTRVHDVGPTAEAAQAISSPWAPGAVPPYPWASNDPRGSHG